MGIFAINYFAVGQMLFHHEGWDSMTYRMWRHVKTVRDMYFKAATRQRQKPQEKIANLLFDR